MSKSNIALNVIPLDLDTELRCSFFKEPAKGGTMSPLNWHEMPKKAEALNEGETLYTDFGTHDLADSTLSVSLDESTNFAKHYINHRIYRWFEEKARLRDRDFVNNTTDLCTYWQ